jgi:C-terminal peptidase prc
MSKGSHFMVKSKLVGVLGVLVLALAAVPARALEASPQPYVVLVGIDKYADKQILPRKHAEADVKALFDLFTNKDYLGVDRDHIRLLLGSADKDRPSEKATHDNILKALKWAADKAKPDDLFLFAFIGQGAPLNDRTCYFAVDSTFKDRAKDAVDARDIERALAKLKSQKFCTMLDVCFKGFDTGKVPSPELNLQGLYREFIGKEDENGMFSSRVLFLANSGLRPSVDLKDHGVFAQVLLDGLKGKADEAGYEADGRITVKELAKYLRKHVPTLAKEHGKTADEKKQKPIALEGLSSNFTLTFNPAVMPKVKKRLARIDELAKNGTLTKEVAAQGKELIRRMPKLKWQQDLRKAFAKLADGDAKPAEFLADRRRILAKTKMDRDAADEFAVTILKATRLIKAGYVKEVNQGQMVEWAVRGLYRWIEEKLPPGLEARVAGAKTLRERELRTLLTDVRQQLGNREDLAKGKDVTFTLNGMLGHLDKHTDYISPEILEQMRQDTTGEFFGIGAHIRMNTAKDMLQIVSPIWGSPAYKAKLYAGDIITTIIRVVDDKGRPLDKPEVKSTKGMTTEEAVKLIKGPAGTKIKLMVEREGVDKPLEFEIRRGRVEIESVHGYKRKKSDQWDYYLDKNNKICYIRLSQFSRNTFRDLRKVMKTLHRQGIGGMVLDLRFNPGGLLDSAVKVSDLFIDEGEIVRIRPRRGQETVYMGRHAESYLDFPMVCLVNDGSASGSEIVAACLQDHERAIIMGERSYGKGSVQNIQDFDATGGKIKLTTATYWRPNGKNINKSSTKGRAQDEWGVTPNKGYVLKLSPKDQDALFDFQRAQEIIKRPNWKSKEPKTEFKDRQLDLAVKYLLGQIKTVGKPKLTKKAG